MMDPMMEEYRAAVEQVELREPQQAYVSSVTGEWVDAAQVREVDYWVAQVREPVRFWAGLQTLQRGGESVVVEVGPGKALSVLARAVWGLGTVIVPTLGSEREEEKQSEEQRVSAAVGQVWLGGVEIDWSHYYSEEKRARLPLPTYPFQRQRCLLEVSGGPVTSLASTNTQVNEPAAAVHKIREQSLGDQKETIMSTALSNVTQVSRQDHICSILKTTWGNLMGVAPEKLDSQATFFELGVDSLLLIQISQSIRATFDVKIPFRRLMEEFTSLAVLATYLDETLPLEKFQPEVLSAPEIAPTKPEPVTAEVTTAHASATEVLSVAVTPHQKGTNEEPSAVVNSTPLEEIIAQQIQLMSSQLNLLRNPHQLSQASIENHSSVSRLVSIDSNGCRPPPVSTITTPSLISAGSYALDVPEGGNGKAAGSLPHALSATEKIESAKTKLEAFVPYQAIKSGSLGGLSARQQKHLAALIVRYNKRTSSSKQQTAFHRAHLSDNRALLGFRLLWKELVYPIIGQRSLGSHIWDIDGNEYVDLTMGFGVHLFGHSPTFVIEAIEQQLRQGIHLGPQSELAGDVAALLSELTGMQRMAFVNSGTEAVMSAMRLARAVTGRTRIASFSGSYHGTFDGTLGRLDKNAAGLSRTMPIAQGILPHMVEDLLMLPYDTEESLEILQAEAGTLAAILVEPVQSRRPDIQPKAFLQELRNITTRSNSALIFDDMVTGFRIHPAGTQGYFGIEADIATYGKLLGGGLPVGVIAGKPEYLDAIDGGTWNYGDGSYPLADQTIFAGTFCKNPLSMAATRAVLQHLKANGGALQESLNERATVFVKSLNALLLKNEVPITVVNCGSLIRFLLLGGQQYMELFFYHLIDKGVFIWEGRTAFLSTAHTDQDLEFIVRAFEQTIDEMRAGGFLPEKRFPELDADLVTRPSVSMPINIADSPLDQQMDQPVLVETGTRISATDAQKQLWVLAQMGADASRAYNESMSFSVHGAFDPELMCRSLNQVIARHDALHAIFSGDGESLIIQPAAGLNVPLHDLTHFSETERERETAALIAQQGELFDLSQGPLLRACFVKLKSDHHLFVLTVHHAVFDGWSSSILLQELHAFYMGEKRGVPAQLPEAVRLGQFVQWQNDQEESSEVLEAETYWTERYRGAVPVLELPVDRPRPPVQTYRGAREKKLLSPGIYRETKDASARQGSTLFMMLLAGFNLLLHRLTGKDDVIVGIHSAGQLGIADGGHLIGHCINLLPLRSQIVGDETFEGYLNTLKGQMLDAYEHQSYPFSKLIKKLHRRRDPSRSPLVEAVFNLDRSASGLNLFGADVEIFTNHTGFSKWELSWNVIDMGDGFIVECDYNADLYEPRTIQRWINQYEIVLATAAKDFTAQLIALEEAVGKGDLRQRTAKIRDLKSLNVQKLKKFQRGVTDTQSATFAEGR
jgi:glutamate-1-semialdehyde aminotransferase/acyl carrier protein